MSSSLKVCQLSLLVGLRTSNPIRNAMERREAERILADRRERILHAVARMNGARGLMELSISIQRHECPKGQWRSHLSETTISPGEKMSWPESTRYYPNPHHCVE